VDGVKQ